MVWENYMYRNFRIHECLTKISHMLEKKKKKKKIRKIEYILI